MRQLGLGLVVSIIGLGVGCHSTVSLRLPENTDDLGVNMDLSAYEEDLSVPEGADLLQTGDSACTPLNIDCQGLCGPIFDPCLNKNIHCGACEDGGVCDLFSHTCGVPKTDCTALGAECGIVKNSCGTRIICPSPNPYCNSGKECDNQTNQCVDCNLNVTCSDYGFECGTAWLGCGNLSNTIECGGCDNGKACNPFYNVCEPTCSPQPMVTLCADAKTARGVECGFISDGCGSRVKCPDCPAGFGCAAQGEQNKCQPLEKPVECVAANRNCGDITSACGGKVHCGDCTPPDVCNANGLCGPPCAIKTCAELGNPACGFVDDGCMGQKKCNDCPMPAADYVCLADHTCCKKKKASDFPAPQCGTMLDDGCGGTVNVPCPAGNCTETTPGVIGMCCVNTNSCPANACNTSVTNSCTGATINCTCASNQYCSTAPGTPGTCINKKTCADYTNRMAGQPCSNGGAFDDGTGVLLQCGCLAGYCINGTPPNGTVVNGSTIGTCCTDTSMCPAGMCPLSVPNTCINDPAFQRGCRGNCASGNVCDTNNNTCYNCNSLTPPANGDNMAPCSNGGAMWTDPAGNSITLTCRCDPGGVCVNGMTVVGGANKGTCCFNSAVCPGGSAGHCMVTGIPNNTCTGVPLTCGMNCPAGQHCSGANGTCISDNNCSNIGVNQGLVNPGTLRGTNNGNPCNDNGTFYQKTGGGFFNCPCTQFANSFCSGDTNSTEGTCACTPTTCSQVGSCSQNGQDNGCGGFKSCACNPGDVCFNNSCCAPKNQCGSPPAGIPPGSCNYGDTCGGSVGKQCCPTTGPGPLFLPITPSNMACVPHGGSNPAYGDCVCTPSVQCPGHDGENDGCGHKLSCPN